MHHLLALHCSGDPDAGSSLPLRAQRAFVWVAHPPLNSSWAQPHRTLWLLLFLCTLQLPHGWRHHVTAQCPCLTQPSGPDTSWAINSQWGCSGSWETSQLHVTSWRCCVEPSNLLVVKMGASSGKHVFGYLLSRGCLFSCPFTSASLDFVLPKNAGPCTLFKIYLP